MARVKKILMSDDGELYVYIWESYWNNDLFWGRAPPYNLERIGILLASLGLHLDRKRDRPLSFHREGKPFA